MFKIYDDLLSPNEGACLMKMYDELVSPNEGACSRDMMNRNHQVRRRCV